MTRPSNQLDYKRTGLYTISKGINKDADKLDLPYTIWKHNVLHILLLAPCIPPTAGQPQSDQQLTIVGDSEEWKVERILGSMRRSWKVHLLKQWAGYSFLLTSWEPAEILGNAQDSVNHFYQEHLRKPRQSLDLVEWDQTFSTGVIHFLFSYASRASINVVGMGCYHLPREMEFPCAPNLP